jgi:lipoic acid synthetase
MREKKPEWLKIKYHSTIEMGEVQAILKGLSLHTVCEEAACPNQLECFGRKTATFMILGRICSRNCTFCNVEKGVITGFDEAEPIRTAEAVEALKLKHVVITSVTRDDLQDGGAGHFAKTISEIRKKTPQVIIEVLIPDFQGDRDALLKVIEAKPEIINHNIETVPRLYSEVRPMAIYERSLELIKRVKDLSTGIMTKSGIMVGLGEREEEVIEALQNLREADCDLLTIGQYLAPSKKHHPVVEYIHPDLFKKYEEIGMEIGFKHIASGPLVRSSYHADKAFNVVGR